MDMWVQRGCYSPGLCPPCDLAEGGVFPWPSKVSLFLHLTNVHALDFRKGSFPLGEIQARPMTPGVPDHKSCPCSGQCPHRTQYQE